MDVEEHFQVHGFERVIARESWPSQESRVGRNVDVLLDLCRRHGVKGTWFVLGWCAERAGTWLESIRDEGHEVASHGHAHQLVYRQGPEEFREDVRRSKAHLEERLAVRVLGYRAPSYSVTRKSLWACDVLAQEGYRYDSSVYPIARRRYGIPDAPLSPWIVRPDSGGSLVEFPMTVLEVAGMRVPAASGAYLRLFPGWLHHAALRQAARAGRPAVLNVHPWEVDPGQPRVGVTGAPRFLHYTGLDRTLPRLESLLSAHTFAPFLELLPGQSGAA